MDNSSNTTANNIALAAAILAAAAFFVSILQAILQYTSSSYSRHKCTTAAIGASAREVRFTWSFSSWRLKVFYPVLNFDSQTVMNTNQSQRYAAINYSLADLAGGPECPRGWALLGDIDEIGSKIT
jgi:hypothetical protein